MSPRRQRVLPSCWLRFFCLHSQSRGFLAGLLMTIAKLKRAFTLVEVLIVVVIMAVLAAVVIPQFSSSTDDAKKSTSDFNVNTLRSVIQIYKAQHNGRYPVHDATAKSLTVLVSKTKVDGTIDAAAGTCGP